MASAIIGSHRACARLLRGGAMAALAIATQAHAGAFYLQEQSVKGAGRAFSGEVADQGAESLWWNPAATGGNATGTAALGITYIHPTGEVNDLGTVIVRPGQAPAAVGGDPSARNPINNGWLPSGAVGVKLGERLSLGLAVTAPYSFTTNYDGDSWARYTADKTRLRTIDIQPSLAFAPAPWLSVGVALNAEHARATLSNKLPQLLAALPDGEQTLQGKGWDFGWSAGAQLRAMDGALSVGASYKSSINHGLKGDVTVDGLLGPLAANNFSSAAKASFRTPWQAIVGARFKVTPAIALDAQVVRLGWGKFDAIDLNEFGTVPENYRNTWSMAGGVDYDVTATWTVRAGVQHDQSPTRDGARDARVPDSNRMNYAAGTSFKFGGVTIDAAVTYIDFKDAAIDRTSAAYVGTPAQTPILVDGELHGAHAWTFGLGGRLSF